MNIYLCEVFVMVNDFDSETHRTFITARSRERAKEAAEAAFPDGTVTISQIGPA